MLAHTRGSPLKSFIFKSSPELFPPSNCVSTFFPFRFMFCFLVRGPLGPAAPRLRHLELDFGGNYFGSRGVAALSKLEECSLLQLRDPFCCPCEVFLSVLCDIFFSKSEYIIFCPSTIVFHVCCMLLYVIFYFEICSNVVLFLYFSLAFSNHLLLFRSVCCVFFSHPRKDHWRKP